MCVLSQFNLDPVAAAYGADNRQNKVTLSTNNDQCVKLSEENFHTHRLNKSALIRLKVSYPAWSWFFTILRFQRFIFLTLTKGEARYTMRRE